MTIEPTNLGQTALVGWREKVANGVARPLARRTAISEEPVRAAIGALFFGLSVYYVASTVRRAPDEARS
jgi:hypothetical protein